MILHFFLFYIFFFFKKLQGSGKSSVSKYLSKRFGHVICSADSFFTNKDGEYKFDGEALSSAHQFCFDRAVKAMEEGHSVIIDNTNSRKSEYKKYLKEASLKGFHTSIVEIYCCDSERAKLFSKRSVHDVPLKSIMSMEARWETDDEAIMLEPFLNSSFEMLENANPNQKASHQSHLRLQQYLSNNKFYHNSKKRNKTHLVMDVGGNSAIYLEVPTKFRNEFYKVYYECDEPKYLAELIQDKFRMFFDFDFQEKQIENSFLISLCQVVSEQLSSRVYLTGCTTNGKCGFHLHCYDSIVDEKKAIQIRQQILEIFKEKFAQINWESTIDDGVYKQGIRMFGSRKVTKQVDMGRVYQIYFMIEKDGNLVNDPIQKLFKQNEAWKILEQLSIHI